ncbi:MAG: hydrolase [Actinomycetota bacterium]|nr:hydrolase [Actinomycetota bacterium]
MAQTADGRHAWICATCAVQHEPGARPPRECAICSDERQFVPPSGQRWTTLPRLREEGHRSDVRRLEPGLHGVGVRPTLGIGQRALLVVTPHGNVLWDCVGYIDDEAVARLAALGGVDAIAPSHPHFHGCMVEYSRAFGGAPVWVAQGDRDWVRRPDPAVRLWDTEAEVLPGVTLVQCGGHFEGSAVLHWRAGADGRGALLVGDTATVVADRAHVSFMRSYPNELPLPAPTVRRIVGAIGDRPFDRIYGGWWDRVVDTDGAAALRRSAERYLRWMGAA